MSERCQETGLSAAELRELQSAIRPLGLFVSPGVPGARQVLSSDSGSGLCAAGIRKILRRAKLEADK